MQRVRLGRTEIQVSAAGLGCGGNSRLGLATGSSSLEAENLVREAIEHGINVFDTARVYGTEEIVGRAVAGKRNDVVVSSKTMFMRRDQSYMSASELVSSLEKSLTRLRSDYLDIFFIHGVTDTHLDRCFDEYVPELERQKSLGKIRHLGITESFQHDPQHQMLVRAIPSGCFDVIMVGFNFLNAIAREHVLKLALKHDTGTLAMHAVRRALSDRERLRQIVVDLAEVGEIDPAIVDLENPLGFLEEIGAHVTDIAYRYCSYEPGVSVVLIGTGNKDHLAQNVAAVNGGPVSEEIMYELNRAFGAVRSSSAD